MARTNNLNNFLTDVAEAIRAKTGDSDLIAAADFDTEIMDIPTGGIVSETGTFTLNAATSELTITFTNRYATCPKYLIIENNTGNPPQTTAYTVVRLMFIYTPYLQGVNNLTPYTNVINSGCVTGLSCKANTASAQIINASLVHDISTAVPSEATANQKRGYAQYYFPVVNYTVDHFYVKMSEVMSSNAATFEANTEYKWTAVW